jgi:hypothetical protein
MHTDENLICITFFCRLTGVLQTHDERQGH